MEKICKEIEILLKNNKIANDKLSKIINDYSFFSIRDLTSPVILDKMINQIKESKVLIINQIKDNNNYYFILSFKRTILIIEQSSKTVICDLLSQIPELKICFLSNTQKIFDDYFGKDIKYSLIDLNNDNKEEIKSFNDKLALFGKSNRIHVNSKVWNFIYPCISCYSIKESYLKINNNRISSFYQDLKQKSPKKFHTNEYIELRRISQGSTFSVHLVYDIENEELLAVKKLINNSIGKDIGLYEREVSNYSKISHPLIPKFYGTLEEEKYLFIEYINGQTLKSIKEMKTEDKISVILGIIICIEYFHENDYVLRDLKPDNIMIDENENKNVVLIDFDHVLKLNNNNDSIKNEEYTCDFGSDYVDPLVNSGDISLENDIFSLGKIITFIINLKEPNSHEANISKYDKLQTIAKQCVVDFKESRPKIDNIFATIYEEYQTQIQFDKYEDLPQVHFLLGMFYFQKDINKAKDHLLIGCKQNHSPSQCLLGITYYFGENIIKDVTKAIHYFSLASEQNNPFAQYMLGLIYYEGKYIEQNITEAIRYFSLASKQNFLYAQYYLGMIYYDGKYIEQNITEAIRLFSLASDQNHSYAQFMLGLIYYEGKYIEQNITETIRYFSLASEQNNPGAQFMLGLIYYDRNYVVKDFTKGIYYLELAAKNNIVKAQCKLGLIYLSGFNVARDINKSKYYYYLAANNNDAHSQFMLGLILLHEKFILPDMNYETLINLLEQGPNFNETCNVSLYSENTNAAIEYLTRAANQNHPIAQHMLGNIYSSCKYVQPNINKAIYYYELSAQQGVDFSLIKLGLIYLEGKYIKKDISKVIHYFKLVADKKNSTE